MTLTRSQWDKVFILAGSALAVTIFTILVMTTGLANGYTGANITDGIPRDAFIEQEDFSIKQYRTVNGNTVQVEGFDNWTAATGALFGSEVLKRIQERVSNFTSQFLLPSAVYATSENTVQVCPPLCGDDNASDAAVNASKSNITDNANITILATNPVSSTTTNSIGKGVTIEGPEDNVFVNFSASFANHTKATFSESMTEPDANLLVDFLNALSRGTINAGQLDELLPIAQEEALEEDEEEKEEEDDDGGGSGGGSGGGGGSGDPNLDPGVAIDPVLGPGISYDCNGDGLIDRTYPCDDPTIKPMPSEDGGGDTGAAEKQPEPEPEQPQDPEPPEEDDGGDDGDGDGDGGGDTGEGGGTNFAT